MTSFRTVEIQNYPAFRIYADLAFQAHSPFYDFPILEKMVFDEKFRQTVWQKYGPLETLANPKLHGILRLQIDHAQLIFELRGKNAAERNDLVVKKYLSLLGQFDQKRELFKQLLMSQQIKKAARVLRRKNYTRRPTSGELHGSSIPQLEIEIACCMTVLEVVYQVLSSWSFSTKVEEATVDRISKLATKLKDELERHPIYEIPIETAFHDEGRSFLRGLNRLSSSGFYRYEDAQKFQIKSVKKHGFQKYLFNVFAAQYSTWLPSASTATGRMLATVGTPLLQLFFQDFDERIFHTLAKDLMNSPDW